MKPLLRRLFFWDEPAKGAFFGLTLALLAGWGGFTVVCAGLVVHSRLFAFGVPHYLLLASLVLLPMYIVFLVLKGLGHMARRTRHFGKLLALAAITVTCFVFAICYLYPDNSILLVGTRWPELACLWGACLLVLAWMAYLSREVVNPAKLLLAILFWTGGILVFCTLWEFAANLLVARGPFHWVNSSLFFETYRAFDLNSGNCFWFTLAGFLMLASAYLLSWNLLANDSGCTMRKFFSPGIRIQWCIMAGIYPISLLLAIWNSAQCRNAVRELDAYFGQPVTVAELGRIFYDGRTPDPDFWNAADAAIKHYEEEYKKGEEENEWEFAKHPLAELPKELYETRRGHFRKCVGSARLGELFAAFPWPPPEREFVEGALWSMKQPELSICRKMADIECRLCHYAVDEGDFRTAAEAIEHIDIICDYLSKVCNLVGWYTWGEVCQERDEMLSRILASGLPPANWLEDQADRLRKWEERLENAQKRLIYSEAVYGFDFINSVRDNKFSDKTYYQLDYHSVRFFFPQGWWLAAKSVKDFARGMKDSTFDQFPREATGSILVDFLVSDHLSTCGKGQRMYLASNRVLRGLIAAELENRRTGSYPETLDTLLMDPFANQPLQYRKGPCRITRYICKERSKSEPDDEPGSAQQGRWRFEPYEETVNAVQIWSVGPDGIDDGGITNKMTYLFIPDDFDDGGITNNPEYGSSEKKKDDIRFILPIQ